MVEDNKYDLVMKFCRENVFGTTEGNPTEGSTVSYFLKFRQNYLFLYEFIFLFHSSTSYSVTLLCKENFCRNFRAFKTKIRISCFCLILSQNLWQLSKAKIWSSRHFAQRIEIHPYSWCFLIYSLTFKSKIVLFSLTTIFANNLFSLLIPSATKLQILWDPKCKKETSNSQIHWSMSSISSKNRELLPKILKTNLTDN